MASLTGAAVVTGAGSASAADPTFTFSVERVGKSFSVEVFNDHVKAGFADWNADPGDLEPGAPGDALQVRDILGDGWGIEAWAATQVGADGYRMATSRGHSAYYASGWKTGNIKEGTPITVEVCAVKGDKQQCGAAYGQA
ncbi:hypothetical protein ACGFX8_17895 [Streptomyces sp. NPDC048362]|uniref:hypothetical protein n=1 Tax=Streptomyces sp. NPDC048362 TaxID=3365539 RepID=UPI00371393B9